MEYSQEYSGSDEEGSYEKEAYIPPCKVKTPAPHFSGTTWTTKGGFKKIDSKKYLGSYVVLFFYPMNFTGVCATEIIEFSRLYDAFKKVKCEVIGCSGDTQYSHMAFTERARDKGGIGAVKLPLLADPSHSIAKSFGAYIEEEEITLRATYIIDRRGVVRHISQNDIMVGKNVDEILRLVEAFDHTDRYNEICPAGWHKKGRAYGVRNAKMKQLVTF